MQRLTLRKAENYTGHLWISNTEDWEEDEWRVFEIEDHIPQHETQNEVTHLIFDGSIFWKNEIEICCFLFPKLNWLMLAGENLLEMQTDLTKLEKLAKLELQVLPSNEYDGEIDDDADADQVFELLLTKEQRMQMEQFIVYLDECEGQDLVYLMEKFAARIDVDRLKLFV